MTGFEIKLRSINDVKEFVRIVNMYDHDIDLISGRYIVDAKSIMGIFSLDLSLPIRVEVHEGDTEGLMKELKSFITDRK